MYSYTYNIEERKRETSLSHRVTTSLQCDVSKKNRDE